MLAYARPCPMPLQLCPGEPLEEAILLEFHELECPAQTLVEELVGDELGCATKEEVVCRGVCSCSERLPVEFHKAGVCEGASHVLEEGPVPLDSLIRCTCRAVDCLPRGDAFSALSWMKALGDTRGAGMVQMTQEMVTIV